MTHRFVVIVLSNWVVTGRLICVDESPESERAFFTLLWDLAQPDRHDVLLICNGNIFVLILVRFFELV